MSMLSFRLPKALFPGGAGLANGFGGPVAPALNSALALGDGGGSTIPPSPGPREGVMVAFVAFGEEPAVASSPSECSLGIWTFSLGRFGSFCMLFVRLGG